MKIHKKIPLNLVGLSEIQSMCFKIEDGQLLIYVTDNLYGLIIIPKYSSTGKEYFLPVSYMSDDLKNKISPHI
jgi:hypothetical protein